MTSEILVMNKETIALAADSIVTINRNNKTFSSANKLFALSKKAPVGIMIYSNATFMDLPWETIIKYYRKTLDEKKFNKLKDYVDDFIKFLNDNKEINSEINKKSEKRYVDNAIVRFLLSIRGEIIDEIKMSLDNNKQISDDEIKQIVVRIIDEELKEWKHGKIIPAVAIKLKKDPQFDKKFVDAFLSKYKKSIMTHIKKIFENLAFDDEIYNKLMEISVNWGYRDCRRVPMDYSGVVITGFGEKEILPSAYHFMFYGKINGIVHGMLANTRKVENLGIDASIQAFAQKDMIITFMEGVHPDYLQFTNQSLLRILQEFSNEVINKFNNVNSMEKEKLKNDFRDTISKSFEKYKEGLVEYRFQKFAQQTVKVVAVLPKDELAALAESLVYLTSLKRKLENDQETVGGPIDVAVITKGDGFIWIKRKHYFESQLNPHYFNNYIGV